MTTQPTLEEPRTQAKDMNISEGNRFGRLTVVRKSQQKSRQGISWECVCDCGNTRIALGHKLANGHTKSCGCLKQETLIACRTKHGGCHRPEYNSWQNMRRRCSDPKNAFWGAYGGRGIRVCERWSDFGNFISDMGPKPIGFSIDRIDNDGNYEPSNCRWSDPRTQANNRGSNRHLTFRNKTQTMSEWSRELGWDVRVIWNRLKAGWGIESTLTTPKGSRP